MAEPVSENSQDSPEVSGTAQGVFALTQWSMVLAAGGQAGPSREALEKLCRAYWQPLFIHVRRQGYGVPEAEDLTQAFFAQLLERGSLGTAAPEKGRFRSFLLGALKHFLINEWRRGQRLKRGAGQAVFALDSMDHAQREACEPTDDASPDVLYDRRWAETVLERVYERLLADYEAAGMAARFEVLRRFLPFGTEETTYLDTAQALGLSEGAVKSAIYKMRQRYGALLRAEILQTVENPGEVEDEIQCLLAALRGGYRGPETAGKSI
jgi:RNA polymerase sigma-70 factor (ECF subfamily)